MSKKWQNVVLAFSGMIVYTALFTIFDCLFSEQVYAKFATCAIVAVLGGTYLHVVVKPPKRNATITGQFVAISCVTLAIFIVSSFLTTSFVLSEGLNDVAYQNVVAKKAELSQWMQTFSLCVSVLLVPIVEEIIFRGFMYGQLATISKPLALMASSVFFVFWHGTIIHIYPALLGGIIFACIYEKTKQLRFCVFAHMLYNAFTALLGLVDSSKFQNAWLVIGVNAACVCCVALLFRTNATKVEALPKRHSSCKTSRTRKKVS